jgi:hypothetical protein
MKLANLYCLFNIQHVPIEITWLIHNHTGLMASLNVTRRKMLQTKDDYLRQMQKMIPGNQGILT